MRNDYSKKPGWDIPTLKQWQSELRRPSGTGRRSQMTEIQHLEGRIPKEDMRTTMPQVRTTGTLSQKLPEKDRPKPFKAQARC